MKPAFLPKSSPHFFPYLEYVLHIEMGLGLLVCFSFGWWRKHCLSR